MGPVQRQTLRWSSVLTRHLQRRWPQRASQATAVPVITPPLISVAHNRGFASNDAVISIISDRAAAGMPTGPGLIAVCRGVFQEQRLLMQRRDLTGRPASATHAHHNVTSTPPGTMREDPAVTIQPPPTTITEELEPDHNAVPGPLSIVHVRTSAQSAAESGAADPAVTQGMLSKSDRIFCIILAGCCLLRGILVIWCVWVICSLLAQWRRNAQQNQRPHAAQQNQTPQHAQQGQQLTSPGQQARQAGISQPPGGSQQARRRLAVGPVMQPEQQQAEPALSAITEQWGPEQRNDYMQQQAAIWDDIQRSRTTAHLRTQTSATSGLPQSASGSNANPGAAIAADDNTSSKVLAHCTQNPGTIRGSVAAADICSVCMDAQKHWACIPCGHLAMCKHCSVRVKRLTGRCPICSQRIKQVMQVYRT
ncbi:hypothetical protein WJX77_011524 [Trebouxia sp. C0004]